MAADVNELYNLFERNFPEVVCSKAGAEEILSHKGNQVIEKRSADGELIAASVINESTVLMLCVNEGFRKQGIGSWLVKESERLVRANGYDRMNFGAGFDYLMPGIPASSENERFFAKRGYIHEWGGRECFDMEADFESIRDFGISTGDTVNEILYRIAGIEDINAVLNCVENAEPGFVPYYRNEELFRDDSPECVLMAGNGNEVYGALIIELEAQLPGTGSIGCTSVRKDMRHRGIAGNMVRAAADYLKKAGMKRGYLSYTYTGLEKLYGVAGFRVTTRYLMTERQLEFI
ncbi:MAG: GNAT family N-acetyltransferase [Clostridiales bacterium]|nr:GNAT family N-acetyltransferase [Clostridiales bacterium]